MIKIYIGVGCQPEQELAFHVLKKSIEDKFLSDSHALKIFPLHELQNDINQEIKKKQGTPFSFQRFIFAEWFIKNANTEDIGIYLDSDMSLNQTCVFEIIAHFSDSLTITRELESVVLYE